MTMKREGIRLPKFADRFAVLDWDAEPMPVLALYPVPASLPLAGLRIDVCGLEQQPRTIVWEALQSLPNVTMKLPLICQIFNWSETVEWEGVRVVDLLDFLKLETHPEGYYAFSSRDGVFFETLSRDEARDPRVLLAYGLNGSPLPLRHGGPLRLVVPFLQGYKSVKWVGAIRAYRHDPVGIKRLLGQSPTGQLNEEWKQRHGITLPPGLPGDPPAQTTPPPFAAPAPTPAPAPPIASAKVVAEMGRPIPLTPRAVSEGRATLREVVAIVRPGKRAATRQALEAIGVVAYTSYTVLGRSRQRGLRFTSGGPQAAIQFLPKQLFSTVVEAEKVHAAVEAIIRANRTGRGQYGDGRIFIMEIEDAVRLSTGERGGSALG